MCFLNTFCSANDYTWNYLKQVELADWWLLLMILVADVYGTKVRRIGQVR